MYGVLALIIANNSNSLPLLKAPIGSAVTGRALGPPRASALPAGSSWRQLWGVACLCGSGSTMSLFIASLAFDSPETLDGVKLAVLLASAASAALGAAILLSAQRAGPPA
jgi:NhaA family Na+:H+ antiporter